MRSRDAKHFLYVECASLHFSKLVFSVGANSLNDTNFEISDHNKRVSQNCVLQNMLILTQYHQSLLFQDHPNFAQLLSYLRDSHQSVQAVSGSTSWWDDFTVARNYLVATAPQLVYPDDGDEDDWERNVNESRNPLLEKNSVLRVEIERLCVANLPGKEEKIQKEKKNKKAVNLLTRNNPNSYVSFV